MIEKQPPKGTTHWKIIRVYEPGTAPVLGQPRDVVRVPDPDSVKKAEELIRRNREKDIHALERSVEEGAVNVKASQALNSTGTLINTSALVPRDTEDEAAVVVNRRDQLRAHPDVQGEEGLLLYEPGFALVGVVLKRANFIPANSPLEASINVVIGEGGMMETLAGLEEQAYFQERGTALRRMLNIIDGNIERLPKGLYDDNHHVMLENLAERDQKGEVSDFIVDVLFEDPKKSWAAERRLIETIKRQQITALQEAQRQEVTTRRTQIEASLALAAQTLTGDVLEGNGVKRYSLTKKLRGVSNERLSAALRTFAQIEDYSLDRIRQGQSPFDNGYKFTPGDVLVISYLLRNPDIASLNLTELKATLSEIRTIANEYASKPAYRR